MGYRLYIAEKPKMGRVIASALARLGGEAPPKSGKGFISGDGWMVGWLAGHAYALYDAPDYSEAWSVSWQFLPLPLLPDQFKFKPIQGDFIEGIRSNLSRALINADSVCIACDSGQEGQIIGEIFLQENDWKGDTYRLWSSSSEVEEIKKAIQKVESNNIQKYQGLKHSGYTRLYADWLIGINFTVAYSCLARKSGYNFVASAGRVQSTLLAICVDHDDMVQRFSASAYYELEAVFETESGEQFTASLSIPTHLLPDGKYCRDQESLALIQKSVLTESPVISSLDNQNYSYPPPEPFNLTTLCIAINQAFGLTAMETTERYQTMYEAGWLTYTRTEDNYYEDGQLTSAPLVFEMLSSLNPQFSEWINGADLTLKPPSFNSQKITEHSSNSPTVTRPKWQDMDNLSRSIYETVAKRMIAQFYPNFETNITHVNIKCGGYLFKTKGKTITQKGWSIVETENNDNESESFQSLPALLQNQSLKLVDLELQSKRTRAPARMTESRLLGIMKDASAYLTSDQTRKRLNGAAKLGTVATRAQHVDSLINKRKFLNRDGKGIITPTKVGRQVRSLLPPELASPDLTALWEINFEQIKKGLLDHHTFLEKLKKWLNSQISKAQALDIPKNPLAEACPACAGVMARKKSTTGNDFYWACIDDVCRKILPDLNGKPITPLPGDGEPCPECQELFNTRLKKRSLDNINTQKRNTDRRYLMCKNKHFHNKKSEKKQTA